MASTTANIKGDGGVLRISATYQPHLTRDEHRPKVKVWISFDQPYKTNAERWTISRKLYGKQRGLKQYFDIPLPLDKEMAAFPLDAAVHFQVYSAMSDSHADGNDPEENFEKDGSGKLYLAQLFSGGKGHATTKPLKIALNVQSCIIEQAKPVGKGNFLIRLEKKGTLVKRKLVFAAPSLSDVVPANMKHLQANIFTLIQRNLIIFDKKVMKAAGVEFDMTLAEADRVHAPLFVNSTGLISPGECYFDNTSDHGTEWDEGFFSQILDISISRTGWTRQRYTKAIKGQHGSDSTAKPTWSEYLTALEITWQSLTIVSNSMPYIADLAIAGDKLKKKVVESFDDPLSKNDGDCEDVAFLIGEIYRGFRDGTNFKQAHVLMAQEVIRLFKACGALGTVTSRNIDESSGNKGKPEVGSKRDLNVETGAHMTIIAMPRVYFWEMLGRTTSKIAAVMQHSEPAFVPRHPLTKEIVRHAWEQDLPVINAEGTGGLVCLAKARSSYFKTRPEKEAALLQTLKQREAFARLLTGLGPQQRSQMAGKELQVLPGFEGMQVLRMQDALVNNPNVRMNGFFRLQTELFPLLERHEEMFRWNPFGAYSMRKIIPVQMGPRHQGKGGSGPVKMTSGVNMVDIVNKRSFVGGIRQTEAHTIEMDAILASVVHLPPMEELKLPSRKDVLKKQKIFKTLSRAFGPVISKAGKLSEQDVLKNTTSVFMYWRLKKFGGVVQARQLGETLRKNALVMKAELHLDHVAEGVATVRLQARVVTRDMVKLNPAVADKLLGKTQGISVPEMKKSVPAAAKIGSTRKTRAKTQKKKCPKSMKELKQIGLKYGHYDDDGKTFLQDLRNLDKHETHVGSPMKIEGKNGDDPGGIGFQELLLDIILFGVDAIIWPTVLTIQKFFDVTQFQDSLILLSETLQGPGLRDVVCKVYTKFLSFLDFLAELFFKQTLGEQGEAAAKASKRFESCQKALSNFGETAVNFLRDIMIGILSMVYKMTDIVLKAITFAGSFIGEVAATMVDIIPKEKDENIYTFPIIKRVARSSARVVLFSVSCVGIAQNSVIDPSLDKLTELMEAIAIKFAEVILTWAKVITNSMRSTTDYMNNVWAAISNSNVWKLLISTGNVASRILGEVEDAVDVVIAWIIRAVSGMGRRLLTFLISISTRSLGIVLRFLGNITSIFSQNSPIPENDKLKVHKILNSLGSVSQEKKWKMETALDELRKYRKNTSEKKELKLRKHLSTTIIEQITTVWDMSAHMSSWIVDGMPEKVSPEMVGLVEKYYGDRIANLLSSDKKGELLEVRYTNAIMRSMTKSIPVGLQTFFFNNLLPEAGLVFNNNNKKSSAAGSPLPTKTEKNGAKEDSSFSFMRGQGNGFETIAGNGNDDMESSTGMRRRTRKPVFSTANSEVRNLSPPMVDELRDSTKTGLIAAGKEQLVLDTFSNIRENPQRMLIPESYQNIAKRTIEGPADLEKDSRSWRYLRIAMVYMIPVAIFGATGIYFYYQWKEQWKSIKKVSASESVGYWHKATENLNKKTTLAIHEWYEKTTIKEYEDKTYTVKQDKDKETSDHIISYEVGLPTDSSASLPENRLNYAFPYMPQTKLTSTTTMILDKFFTKWRNNINLGSDNDAKWVLARKFADEVGLSEWLDAYEASTRSIWGYESGRIENPAELVHEIRDTVSQALLDYEIYMRGVRSKWSLFGVHDYFSSWNIGGDELTFALTLPQKILSYIPILNLIPQATPVSQEGAMSWADMRGGLSAVWFVGGMGASAHVMLVSIYETIYLEAISKEGRGAMKFGLSKITAAAVMTFGYWFLTPIAVGLITTAVQSTKALIFPAILISISRAIFYQNPLQVWEDVSRIIKSSLGLLWLTINGLLDVANMEQKRILLSHEVLHAKQLALDYRRTGTAFHVLKLGHKAEDYITGRAISQAQNTLTMTKNAVRQLSFGPSSSTAPPVYKNAAVAGSSMVVLSNDGPTYYADDDDVPLSYGDDEEEPIFD